MGEQWVVEARGRGQRSGVGGDGVGFGELLKREEV